MQTQLHFMKQVYYRLQRRYGLPVQVLKIAEHSRELQDGVKTTVLAVRQVRRAIVLRGRNHREFTYDLAYISANKDFTTGGYYDPTDVRVVIKGPDLVGFEPDIGDFFVTENKTYQIKELYEYPEATGYNIVGRLARGAEFVHARSAHNGLILTDSASSVSWDSLHVGATSVLVLTQAMNEVT